MDDACIAKAITKFQVCAVMTVDEILTLLEMFHDLRYRLGMFGDQFRFAMEKLNLDQGLLEDKLFETQMGYSHEMEKLRENYILTNQDELSTLISSE